MSSYDLEQHHISKEKLRSSPPPMKFVFPSIKSVGYGVLAGQGAAGKSYYALMKATSYASQCDIFGFYNQYDYKAYSDKFPGWSKQAYYDFFHDDKGYEPNWFHLNHENKKVMYLTFEDDGEVAHTRHKQIMSNVPQELHDKIYDNLLIYDLSGAINPTLGVRNAQGVVDMSPLSAAITNKAKAENVGLIIIDTFSTAIAGLDENSGADMSQLLSKIRFIAREVGAFILIVHHTTKSASTSGASKSSMESSRGWGGITYGSKGQFNLSIISEKEYKRRILGKDENADVVIEEADLNQYIFVENTKVNYGAKSAPVLLHRPPGSKGVLKRVYDDEIPSGFEELIQRKEEEAAALSEENAKANLRAKRFKK